MPVSSCSEYLDKKVVTLRTGPELEPKQVATETAEEARAEAKKATGTTHEQNGDIQKTTEVNDIGQKPNARINQTSNGDLQATEVNGGPPPELEADSKTINRTHEENTPNQTATTSTNSVAGANPIVHANPVPEANPKIDAHPGASVNPMANANLQATTNSVANANPVAESNYVADPTSVGGNFPSLVDTSTMTGLKPAASEVSKAYIEDGMTGTVTETMTESKVH